jgi:hypothetical protein
MVCSVSACRPGEIRCGRVKRPITHVWAAVGDDAGCGALAVWYIGQEAGPVSSNRIDSKIALLWSALTMMPI